MQLRIVAAVAAAGVIGAAGRWALAAGLDSDWALLIANIVGCSVVGWVTARHERTRRSRRPAAAQTAPAPSPWLAAGFCGALTSMSALALQLAAYLDDGRVGTAVAWLGLTVVACTAAFVSGRSVATAQRGRP
ncbi:MAG: CrcB family protein [Acidimicrobiaceae bacterium]|nr:CrcB family protein [Acidimicrobiaceae bacterium]